MPAVTVTSGPSAARSAVQPVERAAEVGPPHVVPVDDAADDGGAGQPGDRTGRQRAADEVERDAVDPGAGEHRQGRPEVAERCRDQQRGPLGAGQLGREHGVGPPDRRVHPLGRDAERLRDQARLVELDPRRTGAGEGPEQVGVDRQQVVEAVEREEAVRGAVGGLGQQQERHRPHDDRPRQHAVGQALGELADRAVVAEPQRRRGADLRHEVVVVGVEPLGHLERQVGARAARERRVRRERQALPGAGARWANRSGSAPP